MYNLANLISLSRILFSLLLLVLDPLSPLFFIIFIICGISDILDGYIARNYGLETDFGAKLDSIADILFFLCFLISLLPILKLSYLMILVIIIIVLIKIISIVMGFLKFNEFSLVHTYLNKIVGLYLILLPFSLLFTSSDGILEVLCLIAALASIEELVIIVSSDDLNLNRKSIFKK